MSEPRGHVLGFSGLSGWPVRDSSLEHKDRAAWIDARAAWIDAFVTMGSLRMPAAALCAPIAPDI